MGPDLQKRFEALFREMKAHPEVKVLSESHKFYPYDGNLVVRLGQMLTEKHGYTLPASVQEIANFPLEVSLFWKVKSTEEPELIGEFHLENVLNALGLDKNKVPIYNDDLDAEKKALFQKARYFDMQPSQGWDTGTVLMPEAQADLPSLWFLDEDALFEMDLSLPDYFDALFMTKGMYYWQYLYCEPGAYAQADYYKKQYIARMMEALPSLFPEADYEDLRKRFEQVRS